MPPSPPPPPLFASPLSVSDSFKVSSVPHQGQKTRRRKEKEKKRWNTWPGETSPLSSCRRVDTRVTWKRRKVWLEAYGDPGMLVYLGNPPPSYFIFLLLLLSLSLSYFSCFFFYFCIYFFSGFLAERRAFRLSRVSVRASTFQVKQVGERTTLTLYPWDNHFLCWWWCCVWDSTCHF